MTPTNTPAPGRTNPGPVETRDTQSIHDRPDGGKRCAVCTAPMPATRRAQTCAGCSAIELVTAEALVLAGALREAVTPDDADE